MPAAFYFPRAHDLCRISMSENPFANLDLQQSIDLRWTLRDIKAKRWLLFPVNPSHLQKLIEMGLVEIRDENHPVLTEAGLDAIE